MLKIIPIIVEDQAAMPIRNALLNTQQRAETDLKTNEQGVAYFRRVASWCSTNLTELGFPLNENAAAGAGGHTNAGGSTGG